jgi:hypothetical protein
MADSRADDLLRISGATFTRFGPWYQLCQDIAENFYPLRADFTSSLELSNFAGNLMDGTTLNARETLGNAIAAMLRQDNWFEVGTGNPDRDSRAANKSALKRATGILRGIIGHRNSNWTDATKNGDMDWVSFGNPVFSVEESTDRTHVVFRSWHPRDCCWMLDENNQVDTFFRKMKMTARNIVRKVDSGAWSGPVHQSVREANDHGDPGQEFEFLHVLMRADELYATDGPQQRKLKHPYVSAYIDCANRSYMHERGAPVFNYVAPRMRTVGNLPFGFSPMALNSLPDARMLQDMALVILEQGQKAVDPPTIGSANVFTRDMNFFAGGHTEVDLPEGAALKDVFATIDTGQRINVGLELKQDVRMMIAESWLLNKLTLPTLRDMREIEVYVRTDEFRRAALPFFAPIESNYHTPLLATAFDVAANMRQITADMFPPELQKVQTSFTFTSPLNEADGKLIVAKFQTSINTLAAAANVDKTVVNLFDLRRATEDALVGGGDADWIIPEDKRQEAADQASAEAGLTKGAEIARLAAGALADTSNASAAAQQAGLAPAPAA